MQVFSAILSCLTTDNIKQLACNSLLSALVILQIQITEYLIGIVRCSLHGHHTGRMLRGIAVQKCCINHEVKKLGYKRT